MNMQEKNISGRGNSNFTGPKLGKGKNSVKPIWLDARGKVDESKFVKVSRNQFLEDLEGPNKE